MKKNILLLGATDRFNYGDLLFPYILEHYLTKFDTTNEICVDNYAVIKSNLQKIGAKKTKSFSDFIKASKTKKKVSIIVVGGEVLGASWLVVYSFLFRIFKTIFKKNYYAKCHFFRRLLNNFIFPQKFSKFPFLLFKKDFPTVKNIIYNSVGGVVSSELQQDFCAGVTYFSLRTKVDVAGFSETKNDIKLYPDSAILMSDIWTKPVLKQKIKVASKNPYLNKGYVFFQINKEIGLLNSKLICNELESLYEKTKLPIVLCPIGLALRHEDHIALMVIAEQLNIPCFYCKNPNIWDIMYLIAESKLYIGTSLHGIITAMSYAVPYAAIKRPNGKIQNYLSSWAVDGLTESIVINEISAQCNLLLNNDRSAELTASADKMKELSLKSMKEIYSLL